MLSPTAALVKLGLGDPRDKSTTKTPKAVKNSSLSKRESVDGGLRRGGEGKRGGSREEGARGAKDS